MRKLILAYHRVLPNPDDPLTVSVEQFRAQLRCLKTMGWTPVPLQSIPSHKTKVLSSVGRRLVAITFDDGCLDNFLFAAPTLKEFGFHATFFVVTGYIGTNNKFPWIARNSATVSESDLPMGWEEVRALHGEGFGIGSHTVAHPLLTKVSPQVAQKELHDSRQTLEEQLKAPIMSVCYPAGYYNQQIVHMAQQVGYQLGVVTPRWAGVRNTKFTLRRVGIYGSNSLGLFRFKVSFLFPLVRELKLMLGGKRVCKR